MNELAVLTKARIGAGLDSASSPITKRVYNLGLDEFFAWYSPEPSEWQPAKRPAGVEAQLKLKVRRSNR